MLFAGLALSDLAVVPDSARLVAPFDVELLTLALVLLLTIVHFSRRGQRSSASAEPRGLPPPKVADAKAGAANPREQRKIGAEAELRAKLDALALTPSQRRFCSADTQMRYLKGSSYDATRALGWLQQTLKWRASWLREGADAPAPIHCECCVRDLNSHAFISLGRDKAGWEVVYCCPARSIMKDPETQLRHMTMVLERAFDHGAAPGRFRWMIDLRNMGLADLDPRVGTGAAPMIMSHYPGRLGQAVLLDAPGIFIGFWKMISQALDAPTRARFNLLPKEDKQAYFKEHLYPTQAHFMTEILKTKAAPGSYPTHIPAVARRSPFHVPLDADADGPYCEIADTPAPPDIGDRKSVV